MAFGRVVLLQLDQGTVWNGHAIHGKVVKHQEFGHVCQPCPCTKKQISLCFVSFVFKQTSYKRPRFFFQIFA